MKDARENKIGQRLFAKIGRILLMLSVVYGGLLIVLTLLQSKFVYFPSRAMQDPARWGLTYEDVWLRSANGKRIHGWWFPHREARATLLICHGNAGNISHRISLVQSLRQLRLNVFIFDYQGYGRSEGRPSEQGTYDDARAAWNYLIDKHKLRADQIVVIGRSLGGPIAAHLAAQVQPAALILDSTFSSFVDIASAHFPFIPVRLIARFQYNTAEYVKQCNCPLLVIHSPTDEIIPFALGQKCYQAAKSFKQFLRISGGHNDGFFVSERLYLSEIPKFFDIALQSSKQTLPPSSKPNSPDSTN
jgi:hypothetical protein